MVAFPQTGLVPVAMNLPEAIAFERENEWQLLAGIYLPVQPSGAMWRFSRKKKRGDPPQGWKLHISATILSACGIFRLIAPWLQRHQCLFKAPKSLNELHKLNAGVDYGFSQVGKFVTVYPPSTETAVTLAWELDRLTNGQPAPVVSYDAALRPGSCVYYRFGQFYADLKTGARQPDVPVVVRPDGRRVPDNREPGAAVPGWLTDPFQRRTPSPSPAAFTPLEIRYGDYEAIVQRGRGGVYRACDLTSLPATPCILKEGRRHGETDWLGRDGIDRIKREARFLRAISPVAHGFPRVLATFRARQCFYLVLELVNGRSLQSVITSRERISTERTLSYCLGMARILADIHAAGWAWRDCKPGNFLCTGNHKLCALDFEGACRLDQPEPLWLVTPGYTPPRRDAANPQADDLYALGASFAQVILRQESPPLAFEANESVLPLPAQLWQLTGNLLDANPKVRPAARMVQKILEQLLCPASFHD